MPEWTNIPGLEEGHPEKRIHVERYEYAAGVLRGKRVLDCACGMGYGTKILSETCDVTGVDIDPGAVELARGTYPRCRFDIGNLYTVPMSGYEAFVSFETLEHLSSPGLIIDKLPDSITDIVMSAPIRPTIGINPWHRFDFTHGTLCSLIERRFEIVHVMGQLWIDGEDLYLMIHGRKR